MEASGNGGREGGSSDQRLFTAATYRQLHLVRRHRHGTGTAPARHRHGMHALKQAFSCTPRGPSRETLGFRQKQKYHRLNSCCSSRASNSNKNNGIDSGPSAKSATESSGERTAQEKHSQAGATKAAPTTNQPTEPDLRRRHPKRIPRDCSLCRSSRCLSKGNVGDYDQTKANRGRFNGGVCVIHLGVGAASRARYHSRQQ